MIIYITMCHMLYRLNINIRMLDNIYKYFTRILILSPRDPELMLNSSIILPTTY